MTKETGNRPKSHQPTRSAGANGSGNDRSDRVEEAIVSIVGAVLVLWLLAVVLAFVSIMGFLIIKSMLSAIG